MTQQLQLVLCNEAFFDVQCSASSKAAYHGALSLLCTAILSTPVRTYIHGKTSMHTIQVYSFLTWYNSGRKKTANQRYTLIYKSTSK